MIRRKLWECAFKNIMKYVFLETVISSNEGKWIFNKMRGYKLTVKFSYIDVLGNLDKIIFKKFPGETIILSEVTQTQMTNMHFISFV